MIFTSFHFVLFLAVVYAVYWLIPRRAVQNIILLLSSFIFYGWVHPWFCLLLATSTTVDFFSGSAMKRWPGRKRSFLMVSLACNLGLLGVFKYFNFFAESVHASLAWCGLETNPMLLRVLLPVGISFYTFKTLSYTIDIYRGDMAPRTNFIDYALYVSFFPQLLAGPIERARHLLPRIEQERRFDWQQFSEAWVLLLVGYLKKLVIADNVAVYVNQVFMLQHPSIALVMAGTLAFALQILADFSAYTDIARGVGKLLGFEMM